MSKAILRLLILSLAVVPLAILYSSCGGGAPSSVSRDITGAGFTTVSLGTDVTVRVPAGALPDGTTVNVVKESGKEAAPGELEGGKSVGPAFKIDVGGEKLAKPVTIEIAFDPKSLPKDTPEEAVFLAYYDEETQQWVPVGGQVDVDRNVIYIQTDHLSWWNPFSWNWEAWVAVLKKGLSGKLTEWVEAVQLLTTECKKSGKTASVDESKANGVIQGCIAKDDPPYVELRVVNLKSFFLEISAAPGGAPWGPSPIMLGPGESAGVAADTSVPPPSTVYADFTERAMWRFAVGLAARMLPAGDLIPNEGLYFIAEGLQRAVSAQEMGKALDERDSRGAAEGIYEVITGDSFIEGFVKLATQYGQENGIDMMTKWTEAGVSSAFKGVAAVDVIMSATDFVMNYLVNNSSQLVFNWTLGEPTSTPAIARPLPTSSSPGGVASPAEAGSVAVDLCVNALRWTGFVDVGEGVLQGKGWATGRLYQARDFTVYRVDGFGLSAADIANGVDWNGQVLVSSLRRASATEGEWGEWKDGLDTIRLRRISGHWERDAGGGIAVEWVPCDTPSHYLYGDACVLP